jgi:MFS family permease
MGNPVVYEVDRSDVDYFDNWYVQMDLLCTAPAVIGLLFTVERITEGIWGFSSAGITDRLGRRKSTLILFGISLIAQTLIIFTSSFTMRLIGYALFGIGNTKNSVCYVWMFELMETRHKSSACSVLNIINSGTMVVFGLYVLLVSRDWFPIELFMWTIGILAYIAMYFLMPESPRWLLINGRKLEALEKYEYIADFNKTEFLIPQTANFQES